MGKLATGHTDPSTPDKTTRAALEADDDGDRHHGREALPAKASLRSESDSQHPRRKQPLALARARMSLIRSRDELRHPDDHDDADEWLARNDPARAATAAERKRRRRRTKARRAADVERH